MLDVSLAPVVPAVELYDVACGCDIKPTDWARDGVSVPGDGEEAMSTSVVIAVEVRTYQDIEIGKDRKKC